MSDTTTTAPPPAWRGWLRSCDGRWELAVVGSDWATVWDALLRVPGARCAERVVTAGSTDPNDAPRKRPRRML